MVKGEREMDRKQLLKLIDRVHPCTDFNIFFNMWLDDYDKEIKEETIIAYSNKLNEKLKTDTNLKDTIKDIHDNVAREMYCKGIDDFMKALITMYERYDIDAVFESSDTYSYTNACYIFEHYIEKIAEELKAGGKNE